MSFKYKSLDLRSEREFRHAERLHAEGWKVLSVGVHSILLEKEVWV